MNIVAVRGQSRRRCRRWSEVTNSGKSFEFKTCVSFRRDWEWFRFQGFGDCGLIRQEFRLGSEVAHPGRTARIQPLPLRDGQIKLFGKDGAQAILESSETVPGKFLVGFLQLNEVHIFGYARTKISDDELREQIRGLYIKQHPLSTSDPEEWFEYKIKETNMFTVDKYQQDASLDPSEVFNRVVSSVCILFTKDELVAALHVCSSAICDKVKQSAEGAIQAVIEFITERGRELNETDISRTTQSLLSAAIHVQETLCALSYLAEKTSSRIVFDEVLAAAEREIATKDVSRLRGGWPVQYRMYFM